MFIPMPQRLQNLEEKLDAMTNLLVAIAKGGEQSEEVASAISSFDKK
jgi:hypothetical protein